MPEQNSLWVGNVPKHYTKDSLAARLFYDENVTIKGPYGGESHDSHTYIVIFEQQEKALYYFKGLKNLYLEGSCLQTNLLKAEKGSRQTPPQPLKVTSPQRLNKHQKREEPKVITQPNQSVSYQPFPEFSQPEMYSGGANLFSNPFVSQPSSQSNPFVPQPLPLTNTWNSSPFVPQSNTKLSLESGDWIVVCDTNIYLSTDQSLLNRFFAATNIVVGLPYCVVQELEGLKKSTNELGARARRAMNCLDFRAGKILVQKFDELPQANQYAIKLQNDDYIIQYALLLSGRYNTKVSIVSKDTAVRLKSKSYEVELIIYDSLESMCRN